MAQELPKENEVLLEAICRSVVVSLQNRLRNGLTPEDCQTEFVTAAGMYALAAMSGVRELGDVEQFTAGDLTIRKATGDAAANCLRTQADMLMAPYVKSPMAFMGV